jgi:dihydroneopterin aldolase
MKEENVLNYETLITTYNELIKVGHWELAERIQLILGVNELTKPPKHNRKDDKLTSNYLIDLTEEEIEIIQDLFLDLEVSNVSVEGHTTALASLYVNYADIWRTITSHQKKTN